MNKSFQTAICMKRKLNKLKESIVPYLAWERPTPASSGISEAQL